VLPRRSPGRAGPGRSSSPSAGGRSRPGPGNRRGASGRVRPGCDPSYSGAPGVPRRASRPPGPAAGRASTQGVVGGPEQILAVQPRLGLHLRPVDHRPAAAVELEVAPIGGVGDQGADGPGVLLLGPALQARQFLPEAGQDLLPLGPVTLGLLGVAHQDVALRASPVPTTISLTSRFGRTFWYRPGRDKACSTPRVPRSCRSPTMYGPPACCRVRRFSSETKPRSTTVMSGPSFHAISSRLTSSTRPTSGVWPGQTQHRTGKPERVTARPITIWGRSGRRSVERWL